MFGVLVCTSTDPATTPERVVLKAFSGQMSNFWEVPGWVGPVAGTTHTSPVYQSYRALTETYSARLASVESALALHKTPRSSNSPRARAASRPHAHRASSAANAGAAAAAEQFLQRQWQLLRSRRKRLSHELLAAVQASYAPTNFAGRRLALLEVYDAYQRLRSRLEGGGQELAAEASTAAASGSRQAAPSAAAARRGPRGDSAGAPGPAAAQPAAAALAFPAGTGDCCAPKLLAAAAARGLRPLALAEFWYGSAPNTATPQGRSAAAGGGGGAATREHKRVYGMCDKCEAILGSMLCGAGAEAEA